MERMSVAVLVDRATGMVVDLMRLKAELPYTQTDVDDGEKIRAASLGLRRALAAVIGTLEVEPLASQFGPCRQEFVRLAGEFPTGGLDAIREWPNLEKLQDLAQALREELEGSRVQNAVGRSNLGPITAAVNRLVEVLAALKGDGSKAVVRTIFAVPMTGRQCDVEELRRQLEEACAKVIRETQCKLAPDWRQEKGEDGALYLVPPEGTRARPVLLAGEQPNPPRDLLQVLESVGGMVPSPLQQIVRRVVRGVRGATGEGPSAGV